jgi:hypothetical protein
LSAEEIQTREREERRMVREMVRRVGGKEREGTRRRMKSAKVRRETRDKFANIPSSDWQRTLRR